MTEADTLDALSVKLKTLVPELLDANGQSDSIERIMGDLTTLKWMSGIAMGGLLVLLLAHH